jgi:hypothetical protein
LPAAFVCGSPAACRVPRLEADGPRGGLRFGALFATAAFDGAGRRRRRPGTDDDGRPAARDNGQHQRKAKATRHDA